MLLRLLIACLGLAFAASLQAHPEIEAALAELNPAIERQPQDVELLLRRAAVYERHGDLGLAESDLRRAVALAPTAAEPSVRLAAFCLSHGRPAEARAPIASALAHEPRNAEALVWRARLRQQCGETAAAYADYGRAIGLLAEPPPELYLERAALPVPVKQALTGLDEGLVRLGPVVAMTDRAIVLELKLGDTDAAIARLDALAAGGGRPEILLKRRGDILAAAGRTAAASAAYLLALDEIHRLPEWLRRSPATLRLAADLHQLLNPKS